MHRKYTEYTLKVLSYGWQETNLLQACSAFFKFCMLGVWLFSQGASFLFVLSFLLKVILKLIENKAVV